MNKKLLAALCGLALTFGVISAALANDSDDAGYNTSSGDSVTIGTNTTDGGEGEGDAAAMQSIQDQAQASKQRWSGDAQRQAVENGQ